MLLERGDLCLVGILFLVSFVQSEDECVPRLSELSSIFPLKAEDFIELTYQHCSKGEVIKLRNYALIFVATRSPSGERLREDRDTGPPAQIYFYHHFGNDVAELLEGKENTSKRVFENCKDYQVLDVGRKKWAYHNFLDPRKKLTLSLSGCVFKGNDSLREFRTSPYIVMLVNVDYDDTRSLIRKASLIQSDPKKKKSGPLTRNFIGVPLHGTLSFAEWQTLLDRSVDLLLVSRDGRAVSSSSILRDIWEHVTIVYLLDGDDVVEGRTISRCSDENGNSKWLMTKPTKGAPNDCEDDATEMVIVDALDHSGTTEWPSQRLSYLSFDYMYQGGRATSAATEKETTTQQQCIIVGGDPSEADPNGEETTTQDPVETRQFRQKTSGLELPRRRSIACQEIFLREPFELP